MAKSVTITFQGLDRSEEVFTIKTYHIPNVDQSKTKPSLPNELFLGPVNTKRWVALLGIWLPGEATKPGYTLCGLDRLRQQSPAAKERQPEGRGPLGRGSCVAHSVK